MTAAGHEVAVATKAAATPSSKFLLGSGTKPFVAVRVMQLAEAGTINLDDPMHLHGDPILTRMGLDSLATLFNGDQRIQQSTVRDFLGMVSGAGDYNDDVRHASV